MKTDSVMTKNMRTGQRGSVLGEHVTDCCRTRGTRHLDQFIRFAGFLGVTRARKTTHGLDGQHQDVDRTRRERVNQNNREQR